MQLVARARLELSDVCDSRGSIVLVPRRSCSLVGYLGTGGREQGDFLRRRPSQLDNARVTAAGNGLAAAGAEETSFPLFRTVIEGRGVPNHFSRGVSLVFLLTPRIVTLNAITI